MAHTPRNILLLTTTMLMVLLAAPSQVRAVGDSITLRSQAEAAGPEVTLEDVAQLRGEYAQSLSAIVITEIGEKPTQISMQQIRRKLDEKQVHWGRLICRGAQQVTVQRLDSKPDQPRPAPEANPATAITADNPYATAGRTLRHRLHQWIKQQVDFGDDVSVTIEFEESDGPLLDAPLGAQRLEFEPLSSHPIGRVPVTVRRYDGDALAATDRLRVQVTIKQPAVIAHRSLARGQVITEDDLKIEQITLTSSRKTPLRAADSAVGKQSVGLIREGAVVYVNDVEAPLLVKRGQAVTVRAISGGIVLRTVGRAMEDGQQGEMILLRNERTRERFYAHVTGPQEAVMNLDEPDTLAAQENGQ